MDVVFSTDHLPAAERFAYWRDATSRMVAPVETRSDQAGDFHGSARLIDLGAVQLSQVECSSYAHGAHRNSSASPIRNCSSCHCNCVADRASPRDADT